MTETLAQSFDLLLPPPANALLSGTAWQRLREAASAMPADVLPRIHAIGKLARQMETSDAARPIYRGSDHRRAARA